MIYLELFIGFLQVGMFSFGGAYGAIPLVRDVVVHYGWLNEDMLTYMIAVSESTPGPIMLNMATYVGSSQAGIGGALVATFAVVLPSFVVILLIMVLLKLLLKKPAIQAILDGMKPCIEGIILATGVYFTVSNCMVKDQALPVKIWSIIMTVGLAGIYFGLKKFTKRGLPPIGLISISALAGVLVFGLI